jgi:hypothetical protein
VALCGDESVQLSSLHALTNLSVTDRYHPPYTPLVGTLYSLLDAAPAPSTPHAPVQLQALKILVNLSANPAMVPHLMAAKVGNPQHHS